MPAWVRDIADEIVSADCTSVASCDSVPVLPVSAIWSPRGSGSFVLMLLIVLAAAAVSIIKEFSMPWTRTCTAPKVLPKVLCIARDSFSVPPTVSTWHRSSPTAAVEALISAWSRSTSDCRPCDQARDPATSMRGERNLGCSCSATGVVSPCGGQASKQINGFLRGDRPLGLAGGGDSAGIVLAGTARLSMFRLPSRRLRVLESLADLAASASNMSAATN
mmetsp:Transcript_17928/g.35009  ORF Transcript_17928/g.35009 Transcript_17928/m.35009 type:complete len:220 (+) Transcript_17928:920-1579(+)